jgi:hypothetical protein
VIAAQLKFNRLSMHLNRSFDFVDFGILGIREDALGPQGRSVATLHLANMLLAIDSPLLD